MNQLRRHDDAELEAQRHNAEMAARPMFATLSPTQQATELVARLEIAKQHRDRAMWDEAKAGLSALLDRL